MIQCVAACVAVCLIYICIYRDPIYRSTVVGYSVLQCVLQCVSHIYRSTETLYIAESTETLYIAEFTETLRVDHEIYRVSVDCIIQIIAYIRPTL